MSVRVGLLTAPMTYADAPLAPTSKFVVAASVQGAMASPLAAARAQIKTRRFGIGTPPP